MELPQSLEKQDEEIQAKSVVQLRKKRQVLLKRCREEGAQVCAHKENDHLQLAEAAAQPWPHGLGKAWMLRCNTRILNQVDRCLAGTFGGGATGWWFSPRTAPTST